MYLRKNNILVTTTVFLLFGFFTIFAEAQDRQLVDAIRLFDAGKYEEAESLLKPLLEKNPDHLMINYFYGACRTENGHFGQKEIIYLLKGSTGESPLKTDYYLGMQYQAQHRWDDALEHYKRFKADAFETEQKELQLDEKIQQCLDQTSPYLTESDYDVLPVPLIREEMDAATAGTSMEEAAHDSLDQDSAIIAVGKDDSVSSEASEIEKLPQPANSPISFDVNGEMSYVDTSNFQTQEGLEAYFAWKSSGEKLDSLSAEMDAWRKSYASAKTSADRNELGQKIMNAEGELFNLQRITKNNLWLAQRAENDYWNSVPEEQKLEFIEHLKHLSQIHEPVVAESTAIDTALIMVTEALENSIPDNTPKPAETKEGLIYRIQIGAYSRGLPANVKRQFDKLSYLRKIDQYTDDRGVVVYTTGVLTNLEDAIKMQTQVRREGIQDAFVVPYFDGKRITLNEAKKLEAEQ